MNFKFHLFRSFFIFAKWINSTLLSYHGYHGNRHNCYSLNINKSHLGYILNANTANYFIVSRENTKIYYIY